MPRRPDPNTLDIFRDYTPPEVAARFEPEIVRGGGTLDVKIARVLSEAMSRSGKSRSQIATEMSDYLDQRVTENMLDTYASPARKDHKITLERFIALIEATNSYELIGFVAAFSGYVAVPEKYADVIEDWHLDNEIERLERYRQSRGRMRGWK